MERYLEQIPLGALGSVVFVLMAIFMLLYEVLKQLIFPEITLWQSHTVTILFSSVTATLLALAIGRRFNIVNRELAVQMSETEAARAEVGHLKEVLSKAQRIAETGSFVIELESGETFWSPEMYHIMGKKTESFTPQKESILELLHPTTREAAIHLLDYTEGDERRRELLGEMKDGNGTHRQIILRTHVYNDTEGNPSVIHGVVLMIPDSLSE